MGVCTVPAGPLFGAENKAQAGLGGGHDVTLAPSGRGCSDYVRCGHVTLHVTPQLRTFPQQMHVPPYRQPSSLPVGASGKPPRSAKPFASTVLGKPLSGWTKGKKARFRKTFNQATSADAPRLQFLSLSPRESFPQTTAVMSWFGVAPFKKFPAPFRTSADHSPFESRGPFSFLLLLLLETSKKAWDTQDGN